MNKDGLDSLKCNVLSVSPVHTTPSISVSSITTSPSNWANQLAITSTEKIAMMIETDSVCKQCVAPIADFDFVQNVMTVNFLNYSENGSVFYWDFNDGFTDTMTSPVHKYLNAGDYNIKLIVTNACGSDTLIKKISIVNTGDCLFNIQPGPKRGDDTFIYSLTAYTNSNYYDNSLLPIDTWTWGGVMGIQRSLLRFNLDAICDPNNLVGANLSLFFPVGVPLNGVYDTYNSPSANDFTLYRITSPWLGNTVTWNSQPTYTPTNAVLIPSAPVNLLGKDVSTIIKDMVVQGNNGFLLKLNTEQIYRTATYASSNWSEPSLRPLLQLVFNPLIASVAFSDSTICPNDTIELKASGGIRYKWFPAKGLSCTDCENPKASPSTDTEYTVYIYSCESCAEIKKVKVFIHDKVAVTNKSLEMCIGDSVQLNASNANSYKWSPEHGLKNSLISNPKASPAVSTKYYVEGINGHCKSYDSVNVKVKLPPLVNIGDGDTTICSDQNIVLDVSELGGSVLWQNGSVEQTFEVSDTGKYYVQVTNSCGSSSDTLLVYPCCESIDIPNLFTPNGDIYNEYFKIGCLGSGGWHLRIYNRWGSLVYKSDDYQNNWNGKSESDGVYYYYLAKSKLEYSGWVEILR